MATCEEAGSGERDLYGKRATGLRTVHILSHVYLTLQEDIEGCTKNLRRGTLIEDMTAANKSTLAITWNKKVCHLNLSSLLTWKWQLSKRVLATIAAVTAIVVFSFLIYEKTPGLGSSPIFLR